MKILHLTLKKQWFDMIASGEKKEEYREIKAYWFKRLVFQPEKVLGYFSALAMRPTMDEKISALMDEPRFIKMIAFVPYDVVRFRLGYAKDAPTMDVELFNIHIRRGKPEWGAEEGENYFVLSLGRILSRTNF